MMVKMEVMTIVETLTLILEKEKLKAEKEKLKAASIASKSSMKDTE